MFYRLGGVTVLFLQYAGATKIVPIEASPADIIPSADTDPGSQDTSQKRGYQEYAIQQAAYEVPLKSNR